MKKVFLVIIMSILAQMIVSAQDLNIVAIQYCKMLGYEILDSKKSEKDVQLPNGKMVNSKRFLKGLVGEEYSYCAKKGYEKIAKRGRYNKDSFTYPVCLDKDTKEEKDLFQLIYEEGDYSEYFEELFESSEPPETEILMRGPGDNYVPGDTNPLTDDDKDWSRDYGSDITDQANCNSCFACATVAMAETVYEIETGQTQEFSDLVSCIVEGNTTIILAVVKLHFLILITPMKSWILFAIKG